MEPARSGSCPSGQRRGPVAPRDDKIPSTDQRSFHTCIIQTVRGRKRPLPGSLPPPTVRKPHVHRLIADRLGRTWSQRAARVAPRDNVEVPANSGKLSYILPHIYNPNRPRGRKRRSLRLMLAPHGVEPQPHWMITNWPGCVRPARWGLWNIHSTRQKIAASCS